VLSKTDNEYLSRIGPGTPMGHFMRQYWMPAIRSDELPSPDCPPLRVRLLGESLIGFRMTSGEIGLIQNSCPHRGASLFFGRNEEDGLRCVYHGWKFDATGACVDMPSEPAESNFKSKVRAVAYPCIERNGIIWAYMGPREVPPPLPDIEANLMVSDPLRISVIHRPCNWMQGWEGEMDTVHAAFLHYGAVKIEDTLPGSFDYYQFKERSPRFNVIDTDVGVSYGAYREAEGDTYYWRTAHMLFPFYAMIPSGTLGEDVKIGAYVPMDDEHTLHWEIFVRGVRNTMTQRSAGAQAAAGSAASGAPQHRPGYHPNATDWYGRFNMVQNKENDYLIDREAQSTWKSFTGIPGVRQQDMAVTESMGPIYDRSREHLGTTDALIIKTRRKLIATAKALENGVNPPGVDDPKLYRMRSGEIVLPKNTDWWEATRDLRERFESEPTAVETTVS
jgi:phthalate 4,5-dioxygenase oxygenase subunit